MAAALLAEIISRWADGVYDDLKDDEKKRCYAKDSWHEGYLVRGRDRRLQSSCYSSLTGQAQTYLAMVKIKIGKNPDWLAKEWDHYRGVTPPDAEPDRYMDDATSEEDMEQPGFITGCAMDTMPTRHASQGCAGT